MRFYQGWCAWRWRLLQVTALYILALCNCVAQDLNDMLEDNSSSIELAPGVYTFSGGFGNIPISIRGVGAAEDIIIRCSSASGCFNVSDSLSLSNVTLAGTVGMSDDSALLLLLAQGVASLNNVHFKNASVAVSCISDSVLRMTSVQFSESLSEGVVVQDACHVTWKMGVSRAPLLIAGDAQ